MSKAVAAGLRVGYVHAPASMVSRMAAALRNSCWMATPLVLEIASRWVEDGTASALLEYQRGEIARRQALVVDLLQGLTYRSHLCCPHFGRSASPWRAIEIEQGMRGQQHLVTTAEAFSTGRGTLPGHSNQRQQFPRRGIRYLTASQSWQRPTRRPPRDADDACLIREATVPPEEDSLGSTVAISTGAWLRHTYGPRSTMDFTRLGRNKKSRQPRKAARPSSVKPTQALIRSIHPAQSLTPRQPRHHRSVHPRRRQLPSPVQRREQPAHRPVYPPPRGQAASAISSASSLSPRRRNTGGW